jgi:hypothetical protein
MNLKVRILSKREQRRRGVEAHGRRIENQAPTITSDESAAENGEVKVN